ncbi:hypothetical protein [Rhizobium sp. LC145]|uniref:hypothetical protein n=1 Tax=Rhizobium sp. LC145 TaxID=1120688 RepID=UPI00062A4C02|nr:hypothetical protein [Rhizobium sp. LC145]KKX29200.1 hypothetical protein YH62_15480 [Rhizobium sp. LC145]TKT68802.1 hypothetical protein FDR95_00015 [Rhizobiaceae bacterium LC148]
MTRLARIDLYSVAPLLPGDKVAGRVAARGEHFEWSPPNKDKIHTNDPIAVRRPTVQELGQSTFLDLKGTKFGRFTVLGIAADIVTTNGANWVVRCVCGAYETRKAKTIKAWLSGDWKGDHEPMCDCCGYTRRLQMGRYDPKKAAAAAKAIMEAAR